MGRITWFVDTCILLNILDVPGRNQDRVAVIADFEQKINNGDLFVLPLTSVIETGNFIGSLANGHDRYTIAKKFKELMEKIFAEDAPFKFLEPPSIIELKSAVSRVVVMATEGIGMGDVLIEEEWKASCKQFEDTCYGVWSIDKHLKDLEPCNPLTF